MATRVPQAVQNKQGHAQYSATSTISGGVDLESSFSQNLLAAKKAFKLQKGKESKESHQLIPAEYRCQDYG